MQKETTSESSWAVLAALRLFLSMIVVLGHFSIFIKSDPYNIFGNGYFVAVSAVFGFFLISGFSIAASLDREPHSFYGRRFLRIWPLYLAS